MTPTTGQELHEALLRALAPAIRWRHPFPGDGAPVRVNQNGIDVWENHVGDVHLDPDGTAHAYLFIQSGPGGHVYTRTAPRASQSHWNPILTFAGGTPRKTHWAMSLTVPILDALVLTDETGARLSAPLHQGSTPRENYTPGPLRLDRDPSPPRWYVPIQYATQAH